MNFKLIATCAAGIESIVGNELKHLGYKVNVENGRVRFDGDVADIAKTNLWLRTADRIKIVVGEFTAKTFEELFQGVESLNWEDFLPLDAEFPVAGKSQKSTLHNVPSVQAITKKAIVTKIVQIVSHLSKCTYSKMLMIGIAYPFVDIVGVHVLYHLNAHHMAD